VAQRSYVQNIGIPWMNNDPADVARGNETHALPCFAAVERLVSAIAPGTALAIIGFASANPNDGGIRGSDGDVANGGNALFVEDRFPRGAIVGGLPDSTGSNADEYDAGIRFDYGKIVDAAAHDCGTELAELQAFEFIGGGRSIGGGV
jgi:hypothetical protein